MEYEEDFAADVDANIVMMGDGNLVEFQATSEGQPYSKEEMFEILKISEKGIKDIILLQKEALK